jgi:hypothetical protein
MHLYRVDKFRNCLCKEKMCGGFVVPHGSVAEDGNLMHVTTSDPRRLESSEIECLD